jgi:uncharacterized protein involved in tolerance to divalent cations
VITIVLKSNLATKIIKMNYVQSFSLHEGKILKEEEKILYIETKEKEKCLQKIQQFTDVTVLESFN